MPRCNLPLEMIRSLKSRALNWYATMLSPRNRIGAFRFYHLHSSSVTQQKSPVSSQKNPRYLEKSPIFLQENLESQDKSSHELTSVRIDCIISTYIGAIIRERALKMIESMRYIISIDCIISRTYIGAWNDVPHRFYHLKVHHFKANHMKGSLAEEFRTLLRRYRALLRS